MQGIHCGHGAAFTLCASPRLGRGSALQERCEVRIGERHPDRLGHRTAGRSLLPRHCHDESNLDGILRECAACGERAEGECGNRAGHGPR
jgi:hypothetical protein